MNKKIIIPTLASFALVGALTFTPVKAQEADSPHSSIIAKLVEKFGLDQSEVEAVFEAERTERQAEREAQKLERLNQLVTDGKITEEQKQAIIAKQAEMQTNRSEIDNPNRKDWQNLTEEERQAQMEEKKAEMETRRQEIEAWAESIGLDLETIGHLGDFGFGGKGMGHPGGPKGMETPANTDTE